LAVFELTERSMWGNRVSSTFHGRDILAPVAAALAKGIPPQKLGPDRRLEFQCLDVPGARVSRRLSQRIIEGEVLLIDSFGNCITTIDQQAVQGAPRDKARVLVRDLPPVELVATYGEALTGTLVALVGSSGRLELAVVNGNAARQLQCKVGEPVTVTWDSVDTRTD
jgi:S-adenosylmethionine hydrolase